MPHPKVSYMKPRNAIACAGGRIGTVSTHSRSKGETPAQAEGFSYAWRALRHRNFRLYYGGQGISLIGTWMTRLATSWLVYRLTGSALLLGVVGFAGQIPTSCWRRWRACGSTG